MTAAAAAPILAQFWRERAAAVDADDAMAALLALATVDAHGLPEVRTVVLREVQAQLAIFVNRTSPKWTGLQGTVSFMTYWPSSQLQYRFVAKTEPIDKALVDQSWLLRPEVPRRIDHLYEQWQPQSSAVTDRETLVERCKDLDAALLTQPAAAAMGLYLVPVSVDRLDLNQPGEPHDRRRYAQAHSWQEEVLLP